MKFDPLNDRCRVEYRSTTQDSYGAEVETWVLLGVRYCKLIDRRASRSESVRQGLAVSLNQTTLQMNYCSDIDSTMRVIVNRPDPTIYQIIAGPDVLGNKDRVEFVIERVSTENG